MPWNRCTPPRGDLDGELQRPAQHSLATARKQDPVTAADGCGLSESATMPHLPEEDGMLRPWLTALVTSFLVACAATPYQPMGDAGGYYHQKIAENTYIVGFSGNTLTDYQTTYDFAVLRAAEIGEKLQYRYFAIEGQEDKSTTEVVDSGSTSDTTIKSHKSGKKYDVATTTSSESNDVHETSRRAENSVF